jgi:antitoxin component YwqK of YwqJK toxin-antitoxin module
MSRVEIDTMNYSDRKDFTTVCFYDENHLPHREDGPAFIEYYLFSCRKKKEIWFDHGVIHRDNDLPAYTSYSPSGEVSREEWFKNGEPFREDGPCIVNYHQDRVILESFLTELRGDDKFYFWNKAYRDDGSLESEIIPLGGSEEIMKTYYPKGALRNVSFISQGREVKLDGPARITYHWRNGKVLEKMYCTKFGHHLYVFYKKDQISKVAFRNSESFWENFDIMTSEEQKYLLKNTLHKLSGKGF